MDPKIAPDLRPSAGGSAVRTPLDWPAVAKLQAASVPTAHRQLRRGTDRRTEMPKCRAIIIRGLHGRAVDANLAVYAGCGLQTTVN